MDLIFSPVAAVQLSYHLRMVVALATAGEMAECASEAALAWTILSMAGPEAVSALGADLPDVDVIAVSEAQWDAVLRRAHALALQLQAHFVSEGQSATAALYEGVGAALKPALDRLRDPA
jgi:hypothetical protein